ncbi:MAG: YadA-like family protein [Polaromonas sp.]|jgi:autotransporter adhesin|nr:YadA-like family protein [Polaromonas sp.]MBP6088341.1 YadA-like family protein [Polaromonas sp.]MBP6155375.1 YadA-like family protein [Polaromonas sp.]MBP7115312.1 YadA-like family protein [Polaromonas sp.]
MKKSSFLPTKITMAGIVLLTGLAGNSAWAACTTNNVFGVPVSVNVNCVAQVNTNTTAIATTNTNLATTNSNLATTNTNLATTDANLIAGDAATLSSSKAYTDGKAYAVGADTLNTAKSYTDTRATETLKSANAFTSEQVTKLETKTAGGVAAIAAMASVPQLSAGKNLSVGVGVGSYDGKTAISVGVHKRINESMTARFNLATGMGSGAKPVIGAGAAWEF